MVQLSHPYMTTGKIIVLIIWTFVCKVMSLLFNMLSQFVNRFPSNEQVSFNFMTAVTIHSDFGAKKIKSVTVSTFSPSICHEVMGPGAMILVLWMLSFKPAFSLSIKRFPDSSAGKESAFNVENLDLVPGLGRYSGERKGYPLQYSALENSMDCIVHGVAESRTRLSWLSPFTVLF